MIDEANHKACVLNTAKQYDLQVYLNITMTS